LEDSKYIHPSTDKTLCCTIFISLQSYLHDVWTIQKEIKDAYPKKICHMSKKRKEKRCITKEGIPHAHKACKKKIKEKI